MRRYVAAMGVAALLASALVSTVVVADAPPAQAAPVQGFDPGMIIADEIFYNAKALPLSGDDIQVFLDSKLPGPCRAGYTCLKDYGQATTDQPANKYCAAYKGWGGQRAADIIRDVAVACNINPRVLLVLLQKEQGLVTDTWPTTGQYRSATGYGCPDTAACDSTYYGFFNQVYNAARQFQSYRVSPWLYFAGRNNDILFNPDRACGSSSVFIQNAATAALYHYTPYQPNAAAIAAGFGVGDACSAYGNRNFYSYFTQWFGSTRGLVGGAIGAAYDALGGKTGVMGQVLTPEDCTLRDSGCVQRFEGGRIYWTARTGAYAIRGPIAAGWALGGNENSVWGYPTGNLDCTLKDSGCAQKFEGGVAVWSTATGAQLVSGALLDAWTAQQREQGPLGYPVGVADCTLKGAGCVQEFQGGKLYWSAGSGAYTTSGAIGAAWLAAGAQDGSWGYPIAEPNCTLKNGGCVQSFQGGQAHYSAASGVQLTKGPILNAWAALNWENGLLGYPTSGQVCGLKDGGCFQYFQGGQIHWSPGSGAFATYGPIKDAWGTSGWEGGLLGYPTSAADCTLPGNGCQQSFQGGALVWSAATGAQRTTAAVLTVWKAAGGAAGTLGYPTTGPNCGLKDGGCFQYFQGGQVHWSNSTGAVATFGAIKDAWGSYGWENGLLGYPTAAADCTLPGKGCQQSFQGGVLVWSAATGAQRTTAGVLTAWQAAGGPAGRLGYPTTGPNCGLKDGGCFQYFQGGQVHWSKSTAAVATFGAIKDAWGSYGWENGRLGYPIAAADCTIAGGGCRQSFQGGDLVWSTATGAQLVGGAIGAKWGALGNVIGSLGYPTTGENCGLKGGGCFQYFQSGQIHWSPASGAYATQGAVRERWGSLGWESGVLGYPVSDYVCGLKGGGCYQQFQGGSVHWSAATGAQATAGVIRSFWASQGWENGTLGYPTAGEQCNAAGTQCSQNFQGGIVDWSATLGARVR